MISAEKACEVIRLRAAAFRGKEIREKEAAESGLSVISLLQDKCYRNGITRVEGFTHGLPKLSTLKKIARRT